MKKLTFKNIPLSVPMTISAVGTAASLLTGSKRVHLYSGVIWLGLSVFHGWQHAVKMKQDIKRGVKKMGLLDKFKIPTTKLDLFIRSVEIASYIPGRVRLYSNKLINNQENCNEVTNYLRKYPELSEVEVNPVSGSILIKYTPQLLHTNKELTEVENYIKTHVRK